MLTTNLIALLISFGFISSEVDYNNLSQDQQENYQQIIVDDALEL